MFFITIISKLGRIYLIFNSMLAHLQHLCMFILCGNFFTLFYVNYILSTSKIDSCSCTARNISFNVMIVFVCGIRLKLFAYCI